MILNRGVAEWAADETRGVVRLGRRSLGLNLMSDAIARRVLGLLWWRDPTQFRYVPRWTTISVTVTTSIGSSNGLKRARSLCLQDRLCRVILRTP